MLTVTNADGDARELGQHVDVALDQRRLGDDRRRVRVLDADLEARRASAGTTPPAAGSSR